MSYGPSDHYVLSCGPSDDEHGPCEVNIGESQGSNGAHYEYQLLPSYPFSDLGLQIWFSILASEVHFWDLGNLS